MSYAMNIANRYEDKSGNNDYELEYHSYENDNYANSEFTKKLKCNNINSNLNGIGRTTNLDNPPGVGPEFLQGEDSINAYGYADRNNDNFDVDCINNNNFVDGQGGTGPQGPRGLQGERGPEGPAGPASPNQILPSLTYSVRGNLGITDGVGSTIYTAVCDEGDSVLSGSYIIQNPGIATTIGDFALSQNAWQTQAVESILVVVI